MRPSAPIANAVFLMVVAGFFAHQARAYQGGHRRHAPRSVNVDVQPTPEIDGKVAYEADKAKQILAALDTSNFLGSPYLVSAIYYHDAFLADFPANRSSADPERRVIAKITTILTPEGKADFVRLLHELWARSQPAGVSPFVNPVAFTSLSGGRKSHRYAIDLFAPEGSPVLSASRGIVILADHDWSPENYFSTSSRKGGNAVIIFNPDEDRFYRYCHLSTVSVSPGQFVLSGQPIGAVGHTGLNASLPGHGGHLHFEVNQYFDGHVRALDYRHVLSMLRK